MPNRHGSPATLSLVIGTRRPTWEGEHWRLFADLSSEVLGFSLLVPRRHLSQLGELRTGEAEALGPALARTTNALTAETGASAAYVYVFDHPYLHIHLGPHTPDDALNSQIIRGEVITEVTDADVAVEDFIRTELARATPDDAV